MRSRPLIPAAAALVLALAACGPLGPDADPDPPAPPPGAAPEAAQDAPETDSAAPADWAAPPADDPFVLVFLGDSLFAGYGLDADEAVPAVVQRELTHPQGVEVVAVNAGVNGGTAQSAVLRFERAVPPEASAVLIVFGANDLYRGRTLDEIREDLTQLAAMARASGARPIIVGMNAPPRGAAAAPPRGLYAEAARAACADLYPFYFQAIIEPDGRSLDRAALLPDGLHPNAAGAAAVGRDLAAWLETVLARPPRC